MYSSSHDRIINSLHSAISPPVQILTSNSAAKEPRASQKELRSVVFGADATTVKSNRWGFCVCARVRESFRVTGTRAGYSVCLIWISLQGAGRISCLSCLFWGHRVELVVVFLRVTFEPF